jgi:hypothetical protein
MGEERPQRGLRCQWAVTRMPVCCVYRTPNMTFWRPFTKKCYTSLDTSQIQVLPLPDPLRRNSEMSE